MVDHLRMPRCVLLLGRRATRQGMVVMLLCPPGWVGVGVLGVVAEVVGLVLFLVFWHTHMTHALPTYSGDDGGASSSSSSDTDGGTSESNDNNSGTDADDVDADDAVADGDVQADKENQSEEDEEDLEFPDPNDWGEYWTPDHKQPWDPPDEMEGHMDKLFSELFKLPRKQFDAVTTFTKEELLYVGCIQASASHHHHHYHHLDHPPPTHTHSGQEPIQVYLSSDDEEDTNPDWQFTEQDWQFITWDPHYDKLQLMAASEELRPHVRAWAKQRIEKIDAHWAAVRKHVEQHGTWPMRDPLEDPPSDTDSDDELPVEDTEDGLLPEVMGPLGGGRRLVTRAEDQFRGRSTVKPLSDDEDIFEDRHRYVGVLGGEEERGDQSGGDDGRGPHAAGDHDTSDIDEQQLYAPILDDQGKRLYADAEEEQHTTLGPNRRGSSDHPMGDDQDDDDPMPKLTPAEEAALARMLNATSSDEEDDGRRAMVGREDKGYSSDDEEGMFDLTTFGVQAEAAGFWEAEEAGSDSEQNSPGVFEEYDPGKDMLPVFSGSEHGMLVHPYYINAETAQTLWGVDLVGGEIVSPERNALLSDATKMEMYQRHTADPGLYVGWGVWWVWWWWVGEGGRYFLLVCVWNVMHGVACLHGDEHGQTWSTMYTNKYTNMVKHGGQTHIQVEYRASCPSLPNP